MRGSNQKRQIKTKNEKKRLLLICEGSRTEPLYFYDLWQDKRNRKVVVEIPKCKDTEPIKLVKFADKYFSNKRYCYDEIYIIFDKDEHISYSEAISISLKKDKTLKNDFNELVDFIAIPSNPCFELWLLLHYRDLFTFIDRKQIFNYLGSHISCYRKSMKEIYKTTRCNLSIACKRATKINNNSDPNNKENCYCGVVILVNRLLELSEQYKDNN